MQLCIPSSQVTGDEDDGQAGTRLPLLGALKEVTSAEQELLHDNALRLYRNTGDEL